MVRTNPVGRGYALSPDTVADLMALGPGMLELSIHQIDGHMDEAAALIRRVGADRVILSSDGGIATAPPPHELLAWGCRQLLDRGLPEADVRRTMTDNPA